MTKELEIEFKNMLTKEEYQKLLLYYQAQPDNIKKQTNYYFDNKENLLKKNKMGLRIRCLADYQEMTLKVPTDNKNTLLEVTDCLTTKEKDNFINQGVFPEKSSIKKTLLDYNITDLELPMIGELTTERFEKQLDPTHLIVLDKSFYYGFTDYELELETTDVVKGEVFFKSLLKKHMLSFKPAQKKIARMLKKRED